MFVCLCFVCVCVKNEFSLKKIFFGFCGGGFLRIFEVNRETEKGYDEGCM